MDAAPETLAVNRWRLAADARVEYEVADLFEWRPPRRWDTVFFGFWHSHVPAGRWNAFWDLVAGCLAPGGRALLVDSLPDPTSTAADHQLELEGEVTRRLNDGREFRIVKRFWSASALAGALAERGWEADLRETPTFFLYGEAIIH